MLVLAAFTGEYSPSRELVIISTGSCANAVTTDACWFGGWFESKHLCSWQICLSLHRG